MNFEEIVKEMENKMESKVESKMENKMESKVENKMESTTPKKRGRRPKIAKDIFLQVWQEAASLSEVSVALGMTPSAVSVRASILRKHGEDLKKFRRGRKKGYKKGVSC